MDRDAIRAKIRSEIRPFPREARYPTGWNGNMTFTEIRETVMPSINRLMRYYRYVEVDIPDMIAHGFMRLWEELSKTPDLLATMDKGGATKWTMYHCNSPHYKKFYRRAMYLEDFATRSGDPDEFVIDGHDHSHLIGYATYAEAIDMRIDIEHVMHFMAEKYQHSRPHLIALYYITTNVMLEDAAELAERGGSKTSWWLTSVVKPIREELCELLELSRPGKKTWQEKLQAGEKQPLVTLVERFEQAGNTRMTTTLLALAERRSTKSLMEELALPKRHVERLRSNAHQELNKAYQCRSA